MIFDGTAAGPLLEQFKIAQNAESAAISALHDALKAGMKDNETLTLLTQRMTETHNTKMELWDQLEDFRLDK